jgi:heptose I phosphotransferase
MDTNNFKNVETSFFVDPAYEQAFKSLGLTSIDAVFSFDAGVNLAKKNLAGYRSRAQFEAGSPPKTLFLKRYNAPPPMVQLKNWLAHRRRASCAFFDFHPARELANAGINTAKIVSCGQQWVGLFEKRSFVVIEQIADAQSLEKKLPACFYAPSAAETIGQRKAFIIALAKFVRKFHDTGYRHRDLYLCHIFYDSKGRLSLIDLARAFKPALLSERYRVKDLAQLYYSAADKYFSKADRLRFYLAYSGRAALAAKDRRRIRKIKSKVRQIACHDAKQGRRGSFQTDPLEL